jgi:hypothetical protein
MDPYVEAQGFWQDFHVRMIALTSEALSTHLPDHYAALIEERISLVDLSGDAFFGFRPDLSIAREEHPRIVHVDGGQVATLEPVSVRLARKDLDQVPERWIEIKRLPDLSLVTVIEILSPTNKSGMGRTQYLHKRQQFLDQPVHLVEIDLLLVPCQPGIDMFLGLLSNPVGFHQDYGTESDHEQEVHRAVIG